MTFPQSIPRGWIFANELNSQGWYLHGRIAAGCFFPSIIMRDCVLKWACWLVCFTPSLPRDEYGKAELASRPGFFGYWRRDLETRPLAMTREFGDLGIRASVVWLVVVGWRF